MPDSDSPEIGQLRQEIFELQAALNSKKLRLETIEKNERIRYGAQCPWKRC
jgi:hypothetical protein